mmetsp:Transcript_68881/g.162100  ORF Transcript_68881/g.162100 Transcript_68881/m.162100 type:complete len:249 (-) Transcript_68881:101-847(-)
MCPSPHPLTCPPPHPLTWRQDQSHLASEDTYVVFLSDHGEMAGQHRQLQKNCMYESSVRVPLIISGPKVRAAATASAPVSLLDVLPTLVDMGEGEAPAYAQGNSLLPLATGADDTTRPDYVVAQYHSIHGVTGAFMVRWAAPGHEWKLVVFANATYPTQLFDLASDPEEQTNIVAEHADMQREGLGKLAEVLDHEAVNAAAVADDRAMFQSFWQPKHRSCVQAMKQVYTGFDESDAALIAAWSGSKCQ